MKPAQPQRLFALTLASFFILLFSLSPLGNFGIIRTSPVSQAAPVSEVEEISTRISTSQPLPDTLGALTRYSQASLPTPAGPQAVLSSPIQPEFAPTLAPPTPEASPTPQSFINFTAGLINGHPDQIVGVYVEGLFALPVVQQPRNDSSFVSTDLGVVTQFHTAEKYGVTGFLAHNFLSGIQFYDLRIGQEVRVVRGDGSFQRYEVKQIESFQKLTPSSLQSNFIDLANGQKMTTEQVFSRFYRGEDHVTFQTCLERDGLSNWGLTFIVAEPVF